jgi:hypothetical protein
MVRVGSTSSWPVFATLRTLQHQPARRGRSTQDQPRRFMSGRSGNKHRYARLLAGAMDLNPVPRPLDGVSPTSDPGAPDAGCGDVAAITAGM